MTTTTKTNEEAGVDRIVYFQCPSCSQRTRLHVESIRRGAEILCRECSAILRIDGANPLTVTEVEETDLL